MAVTSIRDQVDDVSASLKRLRAVVEQLRGEFVDKDQIAELIAICAIAQEPLLILGPPGTAKSALLTRFCELIDLQSPDYFRYLLTAFTEPDELLGVVNIKKYMDEHDPQFTRWDKGSVQKARIVFLDEVFRANSAILNTLLSIINERVYYEAGEAKRANTRVIYGASNDVPRSYDLRAFYARFPLRVVSGYVEADSVKRGQLLDRGLRLEDDQARRRAQFDGAVSGAPEQNGRHAACSFADLECCQRWLYMSGEDGDDDQSLAVVKRIYVDVVSRLNMASDQFAIDDRKFIKLFKLARARALFRSSDVRAIAPTLEDLLFVLQHAWEDPELAELSASNVLEELGHADKEHAAILAEWQRLPEPLRQAAQYS